MRRIARETYITANMKRKPRSARIAVMSPRGRSCAGMKVSEVRDNVFLGAGWPIVVLTLARLAISMSALGNE